MVRSRRLELPRALAHSALNAARLPVPPRPPKLECAAHIAKHSVSRKPKTVRARHVQRVDGLLAVGCVGLVSRCGGGDCGPSRGRRIAISGDRPVFGHSGCVARIAARASYSVVMICRTATSRTRSGGGGPGAVGFGQEPALPTHDRDDGIEQASEVAGRDARQQLSSQVTMVHTVFDVPVVSDGGEGGRFRGRSCRAACGPGTPHGRSIQERRCRASQSGVVRESCATGSLPPIASRSCRRVFWLPFNCGDEIITAARLDKAASGAPLDMDGIKGDGAAPQVPLQMTDRRYPLLSATGTWPDHCRNHPAVSPSVCLEAPCTLCLKPGRALHCPRYGAADVNDRRDVRIPATVVGSCLPGLRSSHERYPLAVQRSPRSLSRCSARHGGHRCGNP